MYPTRIRLATGAHNDLLLCERYFQLEHLLQGSEGEEHSSIFTFGHAWGEGIVEYIETGSLDAAVYKAWLSYFPHLEDERRVEEHVFQGLKAAKSTLDRLRSEWELAEFNGKPARELGFHIDINERFYFQSAIDGVLRHKKDGHLTVLENKHTFNYIEDITPMYKNSSQGLAYSVVVDEIAGKPQLNYPLHYLVGQWKMSEITRPIIHLFPWKKSLLDRLNWFLTLGMDVQRLQTMLDMNLFPMRGQNCLQYNRPCKYFGFCQSRINDVPKDDAYVEKHKNAHVREVEGSIAFRFKLDDIIANHLRLIREGV